MILGSVQGDYTLIEDLFVWAKEKPIGYSISDVFFFFLFSRTWAGWS